MELYANIKNETGNRYHRLSVVEFGGSGKHGAKWICKCDCGNTVKIYGSQLRTGKTKSCGCYRVDLAKKNKGPNYIDETGNRYGRLVVLEYVGTNNGNGGGGQGLIVDVIAEMKKSLSAVT